MGASYLKISAVCTVLSFVGLQFWSEFSLDKLQADGLIGEKLLHVENVNRALELLLGSYATVALLANFVLNVFVLLILCLKVTLILSVMNIYISDIWSWFLLVLKSFGEKMELTC